MLAEQDFGASLKEFARDATKSDVALFYFAGHGVQYADENYFLPVDTKLTDINDIEFDTIPMDLVVKAAARRTRLKSSFWTPAAQIPPITANRPRGLCPNSAFPLGLRPST